MTEKMSSYSRKLDGLFHISHRDCKTLSGNSKASNEDLNFLEDQRAERNMIIGSTDKLNTANLHEMNEN